MAFAVKTNSEIREDYLRTLKNGLIARGIESPNLLPGSEEAAKAQALANEIEPLYANQQTSLDEFMPDTTTGDGLVRWLGAYGLSLRPAQGSHGFLVFDTTSTTAVTADTKLIDSAGLIYSVTTSGSYADGDLIPIASDSTGVETNLEADETLRWVTQPAYANPSALVSVGGLKDGVPQEDEETARARLLDKLANPEQAGNPTHVASIAEQSTASVQKAFVYPTVNGPSTTHIAVVGYTTDTNKTRNITSILLSGTVIPYVIGQVSAGIEITTTTVANTPEDIAIALSLPSAPTASPPGPGGGWTNGTPWPTPYTSFTVCAVTARTSNVQFQVRANARPTENVTKIVWLSPIDWTMYEATVIAVTAAAPLYTITIDTAFPGIAMGHYISPSAVQSQAYFDAILAAFAAMGPGEKTSSAGALIRGFRHPVPATSWPNRVGSNILKAVVNSGDEVTDADWLYRLSGGFKPALPAGITDPPHIFTPQNIATYPSA